MGASFEAYAESLGRRSKRSHTEDGTPGKEITWVETKDEIQMRCLNEVQVDNFTSLSECP